MKRDLSTTFSDWCPRTRYFLLGVQIRTIQELTLESLIRATHPGFITTLILTRRQEDKREFLDKDWQGGHAPVNHYTMIAMMTQWPGNAFQSTDHLGWGWGGTCHWESLLYRTSNAGLWKLRCCKAASWMQMTILHNTVQVMVNAYL